MAHLFQSLSLKMQENLNPKLCRLEFRYSGLDDQCLKKTGPMYPFCIHTSYKFFKSRRFAGTLCVASWAPGVVTELPHICSHFTFEHAKNFHHVMFILFLKNFQRSYCVTFVLLFQRNCYAVQEPRIATENPYCHIRKEAMIYFIFTCRKLGTKLLLNQTAFNGFLFAKVSEELSKGVAHSRILINLVQISVGACSAQPLKWKK